MIGSDKRLMTGNAEMKSTCELLKDIKTFKYKHVDNQKNTNQPLAKSGSEMQRK